MWVKGDGIIKGEYKQFGVARCKLKYLLMKRKKSQAECIPEPHVHMYVTYPL